MGQSHFISLLSLLTMLNGFSMQLTYSIDMYVYICSISNIQLHIQHLSIIIYSVIAFNQLPLPLLLFDPGHEAANWASAPFRLVSIVCMNFASLTLALTLHGGCPRAMHKRPFQRQQVCLQIEQTKLFARDDKKPSCLSRFSRAELAA